jgi:hypothetical protein
MVLRRGAVGPLFHGAATVGFGDLAVDAGLPGAGLIRYRSTITTRHTGPGLPDARGSDE